MHSPTISLISPFPVEDAALSYKWHKYTTTCINGRSFNKQTYLIGLWELLRREGVWSWAITNEKGSVGIVIFEPIFRNRELVDGSIHIALDRSVWGRGVIEDVSQEILQELFSKTPSLLRVSGYTPSNYKPGLVVAERLGFKVEGCLRGAVRIDGKTRDLIITGFTREQWEKSKIAGEGI
jgi:RimJ/RimL family protein N-acetyltransferase